MSLKLLVSEKLDELQYKLTYTNITYILSFFN